VVREQLSVVKKTKEELPRRLGGHLAREGLFSMATLPPPRVFGAKSAETIEKKRVEFWRVPKSAQTIGSKGDR